MRGTLRLKLRLETCLVSTVYRKEWLFKSNTNTSHTTDWKSFNLSELCSQLLHRVTSRALVGLDLCRDESYLEASKKFSGSLFICGSFFNFMATGPLRDFFTWVAVTVGGHKRLLDRTTQEFLLPVIKRRRDEKAAGVDVATKYRDCLQYILDAPPSLPGEDDPVHQAYQLLHLTFASSSAPGLLVCNALIQVLMFPEYLQPLKDELDAALLEHGGWSDKALSSMVLMDSFLRETMRMYPGGSRK
jgi:aspirochlorine biosynthesis cytochrome P450 monooxygenase